MSEKKQIMRSFSPTYWVVIMFTFFERGAYQCGFCTPGMIMNARGLLNDNPSPSREDIVRGMDGNLCRCSAYKRIIEAIEAVAASNGGDHV